MMSRVKRIVRLTFWINNLVLGTWVALYTGFGATGQAPWSLGVAVACLAGVLYLMWRLKYRVGVNFSELKGLDFTSDERERAVAFKVHSSLLVSWGQLLWGLFLLAAVPSFGGPLPFKTLMVGAITLVIFGGNCQYYYLWWKYDRA